MIRGWANTYALDVRFCPAVDGCPEHVCSEDIAFALHNEQGVPKLCIF